MPFGEAMESAEASDSVEPIEQSLRALRRHSLLSLAVVLAGAAFLAYSVYYSASRLRPLEQEVAKRTAELTSVSGQIEAKRRELAALQAKYDGLQAGIKDLGSGVHITPAQEVYEVRAFAQPLLAKTGGGDRYRFTVYVNAAPAVSNDIASVRYHIDHPSFTIQDYVATDPGAKFARSYVGWGCLDSVQVYIKTKAGQEREIEFNMCASLGPDWNANPV